jgi:hypothetical protein
VAVAAGLAESRKRRVAKPSRDPSSSASSLSSLPLPSTVSPLLNRDRASSSAAFRLLRSQPQRAVFRARGSYCMEKRRTRRVHGAQFIPHNVFPLVLARPSPLFE